jgi:hypothetical protein
MRSFKKLKVIAALAIFIFIGIAATKQPGSDKFKNLKVLPKNITEDSLDKIMDGFTINLGVDCKYCHTRDKKADTLMFDKDDKSEKEIARNMMRMTTEINEKYFHFNKEVKASEVLAVTCFTCHRGEPMPQKEKKAATKSTFDFKSN